MISILTDYSGLHHGLIVWASDIDFFGSGALNES
jgi:hypothetical protein